MTDGECYVTTPLQWYLQEEPSRHMQNRLQKCFACWSDAGLASIRSHLRNEPPTDKNKRPTVSWMTNLGSASLTPAWQYNPFMLLYLKFMQKDSYKKIIMIKNVLLFCNVRRNSTAAFQLLLYRLAWVSWPLLLRCFICFCVWYWH